jgi:hypothetical protein
MFSSDVCLRKSAPFVLGEADKIWELLCYRESTKPWAALPFLRCIVTTSRDTFVTLLPTNSTYRRFVEEVRGGFLRRGLSVDHITADCRFLVKGPNGSMAVSNEDDFLKASELLRKAFRLRPAERVNAITTRSSHSVWLLARPLSPALQISLLADISVGKYPLSHWGILVTHLPTKEVSELLSHASPSTNPNLVLGDLYESFQEPGRMKSANITSPFCMQHLVSWARLSMKYVGTTLLTKDQVSLRGISYSRLVLTVHVAAAEIIRFNPTYHLYRNNCQNFAKELIESLCKIHLTVETINEALESLYDPRYLKQPPAYFPGSWRSVETESAEFVTAFSRTFDTAAETSFHSAQSSVTASDNPSNWDVVPPNDSTLEGSSISVEIMLW